MILFLPSFGRSISIECMDIRIETRGYDIDFLLFKAGFPYFNVQANSTLTYVTHLIGCVSGKTTILIGIIDEHRRIEHHVPMIC